MGDALNLLLVEDSISDARLTETYLVDGFLGACHVNHERTLEAGLVRLAKGGIDALVLDLGLPDSVGLDTFRRVAENDSHVPVIIVSGMNDVHIAEQAVALGAQDYVLKDSATARGLARAVTYAMWRQEALEEQERVQDAQLEAKDRFISHVSHELRTPLAAVHQFVSLVADGTAGPLDDEQRDFLAVAMRNIGQLRLMIDDLLSMSRFKSKPGGAFRPEVTAMGRLIDECISAFQVRAAEKRIRLVATSMPTADAWCDPARCIEVLTNLVDNAIKFTPNGGIVEVGAVADEHEIRVTVEDSGPGVRQENWEQVFEQFFQESGDDSSGRGGLGLGLYLCRQIVEGQGGRISMDRSQSHGGAYFAFTVPSAP